MTATEKAKSDAAKLDYSLVSKLSDDGDLSAPANKDFIKGFLNTLSDSEAAQYYTTGGQLTKQIYDRVQSAVFSKAYGNDRLLELMADDSKPEIKNIISALNSSASQFIKAKELNKKEHRKLTSTIADGVDLSLDEQAINTLVDATNAIMESKNKGLTLEEYLAQTDVFGEGIKPEVAEMALFVKENNRSSAKLATAFKEMANMVNSELENKQNESLFGDDESLSLVDIVKAARNSIKKQDAIIEPTKAKGGFIDMFTETRGQKQDRENWQSR